ncbi:hypothetical protein [Oceanibium sediminis]|uniref:hypothetical protein n=1 Tax=Oceanibium sediminis TaxID=2026339 RepID=UPI000DD43F45|nr:hypothetical protein [Oceanibium sediminis]
MKTEVLNVSKFRDGLRPGDDVPVVAPGVLYGVFDGATDPRGTIVDGIGAGRLAALTVSQAMLRLALEPGTRRLSGGEIIARLAEALKAHTAELNLPIPPSTTLAFALDCGETWRFLALGDSGIRVNGTDLIHREKIIDSISTHARVAVFKHLRARDGDADLDRIERMTRRAILLGLDNAVAEATLDTETAQTVIDTTLSAISIPELTPEITDFLRGGIQVQYHFANRTDTPLGFDTMNGDLPTRGELLEVTLPKSQVQSIEIFSDGYPDHPEGVSVAAWEAAFHGAEETDFHKIGHFATVKGSTSDEYFDDRTVVIVSHQ